ncbi:MAG TPA: ZIP family metal transporter [Gaiellaceae bacterium]|jgi:ZIP family zinc transporter
MSAWETFLLGAIAGATIFLGLPMARVRGLSLRIRAAMTAVATGILLFLFWDVLTGSVEPVESALEARDWGTFALRAALMGGGFALGLMSLVYYDWWLKCRRTSPLIGPGAAAVDEFVHRHAALSPAKQLALLIATGIGLHNFGEGLAIGQSAASGELALALVLIIGFGLHNATEGFGVTGPLAAEDQHPSWRFLALLGLIGGGPTFIGTMIGYAWVSEALQVLFFALAAGSILYVVMELVNVCRRFSMPITVMWMILVGLALGFATDWILVAAGA